MSRRLSTIAVVIAQTIAFAAQGTLIERASRLAPPAANPYDSQPPAVKAGAKLFEQHCASCHGRQAEGIGKAPPLAAPEVKTASPGTLRWVLRNGSLTTGMPSFSKLPEQQRWQIITFLQR